MTDGLDKRAQELSGLAGGAEKGGFFKFSVKTIFDKDALARLSGI